MERRRELRVTSEEPVRITVLGAHEKRMQGRAVDISGQGVRILVPEPIAAGAAVKIELDDSLILGEVCYLQPDGRWFLAGIEIDQVLAGLGELARLNGILLDDGADRPANRDHERKTSALSYR